MARELVHCVVVESGSGEGGPLWGIVSDLDLVAAALVRDLDDQTRAARPRRRWSWWRRTRRSSGPPS